MHAEGPGTPQVLCLSNKVETTKCGCQAALYVELWGRVWWVRMGRGWMKRGTLQSNLGAVCATDPLCTHSKLQCTLHLPLDNTSPWIPTTPFSSPALEYWYYPPPIRRRGNTNMGVLLPLLWQSSWVFCLCAMCILGVCGGLEHWGYTSNLGLLQVHLTTWAIFVGPALSFLRYKSSSVAGWLRSDSLLREFKYCWSTP